MQVIVHAIKDMATGCYPPLIKDGRERLLSHAMLKHELIIEQTSGSSQPEWGRIANAVRRFGIGRSKFYELIRDRRIKSFCLRERGKVKGIRMISFESVREFLENEAREQQEALSWTH
jgi:hypothetical protein